MADSQAPVCLQGRPASPGLAAGTVLVYADGFRQRRQAGTSGEEQEALRMALQQAAGDLSALMERIDDAETSAVLEFQVALLEDDNLSEPAFQRIGGGEPADRAFRAVIDAMAADYRAAADEYFAARASDLEALGERVIRLLHGEATVCPRLPIGAILLADDLSPSRFLAMDWSNDRAIALRRGSPTAHVAMLARSREVPMVVGLGDVGVAADTPALLDGEAGTLLLNPGGEDRAAFRQRQIALRGEHREDAQLSLLPARTRDGEAVSVHLNIADPEELRRLDPALCDGIGLVRTEFLFHGRRGLPDETEQFEVYRRLLRWAEDRPVTIRTLDAGGDKPVAGLTLVGEANPFLGLRGVRLSLAHPAVFRVQLRALLRSACCGRLRIMIPMVSVPREMTAARALVHEVREELQAEGRSVGDFELGMMVEVPAAALTLDAFQVDFYSIGSNDLTQYLLAAGRDASAVADLADPLEPAVLNTIAAVVASARRRGLPVSLCGDAGADPRVLPHLLATGLRSVSVAPAAVGRVKRIVNDWSRASHG